MQKHSENSEAEDLRWDSLVVAYQKSQSDDDFQSLWNAVRWYLLSACRGSAGRFHLDERDIPELADSAILRTVATYDVSRGHFRQHLAMVVNSMGSNLSRLRISQKRIPPCALVSTDEEINDGESLYDVIAGIPIDEPDEPDVTPSERLANHFDHLAKKSKGIEKQVCLAISKLIRRGKTPQARWEGGLHLGAIAKATGLSVKTCDNAWTRIRVRHGLRHKRQIDTTMIFRLKKTLEKKTTKKTIAGVEHWLWTGGRVIAVGRSIWIPARASWVVYREVKLGSVQTRIRQTCGVGKCVNPFHWEIKPKHL